MFMGVLMHFSVVIVALATLATGTSAFAPEDETHIIDELWKTALAANPTIGKSENFYRGYARLLLPYVDNYDGFISVLKGEQAYSCEPNLLCRDGARVVAGFRVGERPTALDLIRFAREHTCYGFFSDAASEGRFLDDLERTLKSTNVNAASILPSDFRPTHPNARFVLYRLAKARDDNTELVFTLKATTKHPRVERLFRLAGAKSGKQRPDSTPLDPLIEAAAREACKRAYGASRPG